MFRCPDLVRPVVAAVILAHAAAMFGSTNPPASFHVRQWTSEDGLPANRVTALAQTRDGYLWVGTWFGLARFDGVRFVVFNGANTPELPVEAISALAVDRADGALWIGTPKGLARLKDGDFAREAAGHPAGRWSISELKAAVTGGVWVRDHDKVARWPSVSGRWAKLRFKSGERARAMWEAEEETLELMTHRRVFRIHRDGSFEEREPPTGLSTNESWTGAWPKDQAGRFWLATPRELQRRANGAWESVRRLPERSFPADLFLEDRSGAMWVAHSGDELCCYTEEGREALRLGNRGAEKSIDCLLEDREGHLWAGTPQGLFQIRPRLLRAYSEEDGLPHRECWSVSEAPDGAVWVGTRLGLARIHEGQVTDALWDERHRPRAPSILVDQEGWLWSGRKHNGVLRWRPGRETNWFLHRPGADAISGVDLGALYLDRNDRVWAGTSQGAVWFDRGRLAAGFGEHGLPTNGIRSIYQTRDGAMWFGTWKAGIVRWKEGPRGFGLRQSSAALDSTSPAARQTESARGLAQSKTLARDSSPQVEHAEQPPDATRHTTADGLADDRVFAFHEDTDGALWIGTHNGLSRLKDGRFFTFRAEHGLLDNLINWLEEDDLGRFWFSGNRGIFRINRAELNDVADGRQPRVDAVVYGVADGMLNAETNGELAPAGCKTRDGRIWFPTMDGAVVIDPRLTQTVEVAPVAVIEQVKAEGRVAWGDGAESEQVRKWESEHQRAADFIPLSHSPTFSPALRLPPGRARDLQIRYTANAFLDPRRTRFQYRLVNHDADWREETLDRLAVYTNLRPGDYRFELRAANAHGVWSEAPATLAFSLAPHFWQTWPFIMLCGFTVFGLAGGFTAYRLRWQHRLLTARHEQLLSEERARIARDLHDDLGTALTGVALEIDVARRQSQEGMAGRLGESASRVRTLAERMREVVWAVNPRCDTVSSLASFLEQQAGTLLHGSGVRGRFEFPEDIPTLPLDSETRHQLALAVREALTNVLRHARASEVVLGLDLSARELIVSVRDDGRGFEAGRAGAEPGHGLHNLRTRLERVGGTVAVVSKAGRGTRVEFRVTLNGDSAG
jgi:signal transduction histidine kinase/ligand-binding sensor domain-containing protein